MHFITGSKGKLAEFQTFIPTLQQLHIDLPEIQSMDPQEIIGAKLEAGRLHSPAELIVEDTGLYFDCLNGLPGPLIKWFSQQLGYEKLAELAGKYESQAAQAVTWIGLYTEQGEKHFFKGELRGTIVPPRGEGFGWDVIFQPEGQAQTFAEMGVEEKNQISMRRNAIMQLQTFLAQRF